MPSPCSTERRARRAHVTMTHCHCALRITPPGGLKCTPLDWQKLLDCLLQHGAPLLTKPTWRLLRPPGPCHAMPCPAHHTVSCRAPPHHTMRAMPRTMSSYTHMPCHASPHQPCNAMPCPPPPPAHRAFPPSTRLMSTPAGSPACIWVSATSNSGVMTDDAIVPVTGIDSP